jgi:hypothetical protein
MHIIRVGQFSRSQDGDVHSRAVRRSYCVCLVCSSASRLTQVTVTPQHGAGENDFV